MSNVQITITTKQAIGYSNSQLSLRVKLILMWNQIYHDFLPPPRRGSHVKSDNTHTIDKIHPLAHILDT